jgi:hypothetical protein
MNLRSLSFALSLLLVSCALFYSQVTVGKVELKQGVEQRIELRDLPDSRELVVGIGITSCDLRRSDRRIAILMKDENDRVVINEDRRLRDFAWMGKGNECAPAFGYIRGEWRERTLNDSGDTCGEPIYTGTDYRNGTAFKSRGNGKYALVVTVFGGRDSDGPAEVKLMDEGRFTVSGCHSKTP